MIKVMVLTFDRVIKFILVAFKPVLLPGIMALLRDLYAVVQVRFNNS